MFQVVKITYKAFGKVRVKEVLIPNQENFFGPFDSLKLLCLGDFIQDGCADFALININFKKVEVLQ